MEGATVKFRRRPISFESESGPLPFFLSAALWALLGMAFWVPMLRGLLALPSAFDPVSWHAHEALFGYLGAVLAGFLLTAVPNWTGRAPLAGWPLLGLLALWIFGRVAVAASESLAAWAVAAIDVSCLVVLCGYELREIVAAGNWRNLVVAALIGAFVAGNAIPEWSMPLWTLSAVLWCCGYAGFLLLYGGLLIRPGKQ